jgi:hypothetical protein
VQHLAGVRPSRQQRVVAALAGVAERRPLLGAAVNLADEAVDIDDQAPVARPGARRPCPPERLAEHAVELADVPERERAQERPERRRRCDRVTEDLAGPACAQDVAVVDAVRAQGHRRHQGHNLRARARRARPVTKINSPVDQRLDSQARRERRRQHDPGVGDRPLIIEHDRHAIQSDRPVSMHHEGDLLRGPRLPSQSVKSLLRRSFFVLRRTEPPTHRWIEA